MNDNSPEVALAVPELLAIYNIPFHGSLVALPHLTGFNDFNATVAELDRYGAETIRILLPGYTALSDPSIIPTAGTKERIYDYAARANTRFNSVVLVEPSLIEDLEPLVEGVIKGSPASKADLRTGDRIDLIDGVKPLTRVGAFNMLDNKTVAHLIISRGNINVKASISSCNEKPKGLIMIYDLDPNQILRVKSRLSESIKTLMLLSEQALSRWQAAVVKYRLEKVAFKTVRSNFFGGSINCAGLLTVGDFQAALHEVVYPERYEQILIPSICFDDSGRNMCGMHYHDLQTDRIRLTWFDGIKRQHS